MSGASFRLLAVTVAAVVACACGATPGAARPTGVVPSAVSTPDPRCAPLALRGITPCPPSNLPPEPIVVRNGTHGAVPDDTVRADGEAYVRTHTLADWAVRQDGGDTFLLSGAIVPAEVARTNLFRTEVHVFADAHAGGRKVHIQPLRTTEITLVPVPSAMQTAARQDGLQPSAYAWVDNQAGPAVVTEQVPGHPVTDVLRVPAGKPLPILVFGEVREDAQLGSIWYLGGDFGCLASLETRIACGM